jgi:hypothetical protein
MIKRLILITLTNFMLLSGSDFDINTFCSIVSGCDTEEYDGRVYFATDGGLVALDGEGGTIVYDIDDGLYKPDIFRIEKDFRGMIWAGHEDCSFSVFDPESKSAVYLNDIEQAGTFTLNSIFSSEKYIYAATSGLLSRYRFNNAFDKYEIADTNIMTGNVSDVFVFNATVYIALTDEISGTYAVRYISEDSQNINYLDNWNTVSGINVKVNSFVSSGEVLYALTDSGIYKIEDDSAVNEPVLFEKKLYSGKFHGGKFYSHSVQDGDGSPVVFVLNSDLSGIEEIVYGAYDSDPSAFHFTVSGQRIYSARDEGIFIFDLDTEEESQLIFNLPRMKGIKKAKITGSDKRLVYLANQKFSLMDMTDQIFSENIIPARASGDGATNILTRGDGLFVCTWGAGVNYFSFTGSTYEFIKNFSFGTPYIPSGIRYPVHPGIAEDSEGNVWITNWNDERPDSTIVIIDSNMNAKSSFLTSNFLTGYDIFVDMHKDRTWVWLGGANQFMNFKGGLAVGRIENSILNMNVIPVAEGITDIIKDNSGIVWIGTNNGLKYIDLNVSPSNPASLTIGNVSSVNTGPVSNFIHDIEVNNINEKWFATDKGVSVLSPDNREWRHYIPKYSNVGQDVPGTVIKTDMIDAEINDIEFDEEKGIAILSSENGLVFIEYGKIFKNEKVEKGGINTKPSPFINDGSSVMGFYFPDDGNNYNSAKIFDMKGFLIRGGDGSDGFDIQFGWDGRDNNGRIVSTGIYQIIAFNKEDPSKKITGKIAVVRK